MSLATNVYSELLAHCETPYEGEHETLFSMTESEMTNFKLKVQP